jgi:hypothetical protein
MATASALPAASAPPSARAAFIRQTYLHLALAILAFAAVEGALLRWDGATAIAARMTEGMNWLLVLLAFSAVGVVADRWARAGGSLGRQYLGLGLAVVAQAVIFMPLMLWATRDGGAAVAQAAILTGALVLGLSAAPFVTGADFTPLRGAVTVAVVASLGLIVASILFGFGLGLWFSVAMVVVAAAAILYHTSAILRTYRTDQHVAAALALFADVALLFYYVLRIVGERR